MNARCLPGYIPHSSWSSLIRNRLWSEGLADKRAGCKGKDIEFRITPKGEEYAMSTGIVELQPEREPDVYEIA